MRVQSEYEVESLFLDRLQEMDYKYVDLKNYDDVISNFREQVIKFNADKLIEVKGSANLSDSEFERIVQRLDNHSVYESAKILREKWVLPLDDGKTVCISFLSDDETRNIFQVSHQITMDKGNKFICQLLVKMDSDGYWKALSCGSTFESLNSDNIKNTYIFIPNIAEQEKIGQYFANLDNLITLHQCKCDELKELKKGLLK